MRVRNLLFAPILIVGVALAQGTASQPQSPPAAAGNTASAHPPNNILQGRILQDLRSQNLNNVNVKVKDNKVVLSGSVPDDASRANAMQIANSLAQPDRKVVDHINVGSNPNNQMSAPMGEQQPGRYGNGPGMNNPSQPVPPGTPRH